VELKPRDRIVQLKILYYGPAVGGKTTNLQALHASAQARHRGELIAVNSQQERTILFDLLPLRGVGFHGFDVRFQLVAVPGQAPYAATRRLVTRGADAVVFVANSARDRLRENVASLQEMQGNLTANGIDPATIPLVFQYNKRDLPEILSVEELSGSLNARQVPAIEAVAVRGEGVLETLASVLEHMMEYLAKRYRSLALDPGETVQAWTWSAVQQVFGRTSLAGTAVRAGGDGAEAGQRWVQVRVPQLPKDASEGATDKGIVDSYVQASMQLSQALDQMREERDEARRRIQEMNLTLRAIEAIGEGETSEEALRATLALLVEGASCGRGTLLSQRADRRLYMAAAVGMDREPFLSSLEAFEIARRRFFPLKSPQLVNPETAPEVGRLLSALDPPARALVAVPVRSGFGMHALVMFYLGAMDPLPSPAVLGHVGLMARALAAWFVVQRSRTLEAGAEAARRALPEIEQVTKLASDLVRAAVRDPARAREHLARAARTLEGVSVLANKLQVQPRPRATS
jgi:signal recognition particle receptor subunit beta